MSTPEQPKKPTLTLRRKLKPQAPDPLADENGIDVADIPSQQVNVRVLHTRRGKPHVINVLGYDWVADTFGHVPMGHEFLIIRNDRPRIAQKTSDNGAIATATGSMLLIAESAPIFLKLRDPGV